MRNINYGKIPSFVIPEKFYYMVYYRTNKIAKIIIFKKDFFKHAITELHTLHFMLYSCKIEDFVYIVYSIFLYSNHKAVLRM